MRRKKFQNIKEIFEIDFDGAKDNLSYEIKDNMLIINAKPDTAFKIILEG